MQLTNDQITKYQSIYLETLGEPISKGDALVQGLALVRLVANAQPKLPNNEQENHYEPKQIRDN